MKYKNQGAAKRTLVVINTTMRLVRPETKVNIWGSNKKTLHIPYTVPTIFMCIFSTLITVPLGVSTVDIIYAPIISFFEEGLF